LVNSDDYNDKHFVIEDSCAEGWLPITVEIDQAEITQLNPGTVYVQQGGG